MYENYRNESRINTNYCVYAEIYKTEKIIKKAPRVERDLPNLISKYSILSVSSHLWRDDPYRNQFGTGSFPVKGKEPILFLKWKEDKKLF